MQTHYGRAWVNQRVAETVALWSDCDDRNIPAGQEFTPEEQSQREEAYDEALSAVEQELERASSQKPLQSAAVEQRLLRAFAQFSASALHLEPDAIGLLNDQLIPVGLNLSVWARQFDPKLTMEGITQACRNAWTACGMQPLLGLPIKLTPAILAYSLLYPYSDNYLDREDLSPNEKRRFSQRFLSRLCGDEITAGNHREAAIWALIELIEDQYPRDRYPHVFESLIAIHGAQEKSIQQVTDRSFDLSELLRLSCEKGGTSVSADARLASPVLSAEEMRFAFEWGVLLQLGDDLQDVQEDLRRGSMTLFSVTAKSGIPLDALAARLLHFGEKVGSDMSALPNGPASLKSLLKMSWRSLIVGAVAESSSFFTNEFLRYVEHASPFRFSFLSARRQRLNGQRGLYAGMFELLLKARAIAPSSLTPTGLSPQCVAPRLHSPTIQKTAKQGT